MNYEYAPDPFVPTDLQALRPAALCSLCEAELYCGQCCYRLGAATICERCLLAYARAYFRTARVRLEAAP